LVNREIVDSGNTLAYHRLPLFKRDLRIRFHGCDGKARDRIHSLRAVVPSHQ
jgi:hypothetical protein